jgi:8-oxo-dGTP diphosphatase
VAIRRVVEIVAAIEPFDETERSHQARALAWLHSTDDICRRAKPATPSPHLVSYAVLADPSDWSVFLVDHVLAGLWLPAGGHVEPGEHPRVTALREAKEELGIDATPLHDEPAFLTVTRTRDDVHTDISLWYLLQGDRQLSLVLDPREFNDGRWWAATEIEQADPVLFDPHMGRFLAKVR